jgi:hypothetical protein
VIKLIILRPKSKRYPVQQTTIPENEFVYPRLQGSENTIWINRANATIKIRMAEYQHDELNTSILKMLRNANRSIKASRVLAQYDSNTQILDFGFIFYPPSNNDNAIKRIRKIAETIRTKLRKD